MTAPLPHDNVLTRLGVSEIHGIGVFALAPIAAGTTLFAADQGEIRWIPAAALDGLTPEARAFYDDFAIRRGDLFGCPTSFDLLTPGWCMNQPPPGGLANVVARPDCTMIAARDIGAGEELTVDYATFSDC